MYMWSYTQDNIQSAYNEGAALFLEGLLGQKLITQEQHDNWLKQFGIIVYTKGVFSKLFDKFVGVDNSSNEDIYLRFIQLSFPVEENKK